MGSLKDTRKPDRGPMISYLTSGREASRKDAIGVLRFFASLRCADTAVQLPIMDKCLAWIVRFFFDFVNVFCKASC